MRCIIQRSAILYLVIIIETMYIIYNFGPRKQESTLRRRFTRPVNFTQHEICTLEHGFTDQEHPLLIERLQTHWIHKLSPGPLTLKKPHLTHYSQHGQSILVEKLMTKKTNGFFIEVGALDGETHSNSLFFEQSRNWTGLLIEPLTPNFRTLLSKHRNAYSINACLNTKNITGRYPYYDGFYFGQGGLADLVRINGYVSGRKLEVQCFTLHSILRAIGVRHIDFFSLDVEGAEMGILKTIPFSYISIDFFLIEYGGKQQRYIEYDRFLADKGYELLNKTWLDLYYRMKLPSTIRVG